MAVNRGTPSVEINANLDQLIYTDGVLTRFTREITTNAYKSDVSDAVHAVFSRDFDRHMALIAKASKENYHHVYEYNPAGGYGWIGVQKAQLWTHVARREGGGRVNFTWEWLPAKQPNPTYVERRSGRIGHDAMRNIPFKQFQDLIANSDGRRHVFIWKAPMLEFGIVPQITPKEAQKLVVPVHTVKSPALAKKRGSGPNILFLKLAQPEHNAPGPTVGNFTAQWTYFWGVEVPGKFQETFADAVERDAAKNIANAIKKKKPVTRARKRGWSFSAISNHEQAYAQGQAAAVAAMKVHRRTISQIVTRRRGIDADII